MNANANRMRKGNVMHGVYLMRWSRSFYMMKLELPVMRGYPMSEKKKTTREKQHRMRQNKSYYQPTALRWSDGNYV